MVSCQPKIPATTGEAPLSEEQGAGLDMVTLAEHLGYVLQDTSLEEIKVDRFVSTGLYEAIFAPNTAYETKITVYKIKLDTASIVLLNGQYQSLPQLASQYPKDYLMLTNGGMFHPQGDPVGLFHNDSGQLKGVTTEAGHGNFFMQPNGVFYITKDNQAGVLETQTFVDSIYNKETALKMATQSGPMLLINGRFHPKFREQSTSKYIRSGVGVNSQQEVIFILSEELVNLHTFARIFLEKDCKNALYLDGAISSMYLKDRADQLQNFRTNYGPVIGIYSNKGSNLAIDPSLDSFSIPMTDTLPTPILPDSLPQIITNDSL